MGVVPAAVLAALVSSAAIAGAAQTPLALKRIVATRQAERFTLRIELNQKWRNSALQEGSGNEVRVFYDASGDGRADYVGRLVYGDGELSETIAGRSRYEPVPVKRPSQMIAKFTHRVDVMFPNPAKPGLLRIAVVVETAGRKIDRLPRQGWFDVPSPPQRTVSG